MTKETLKICRMYAAMIASNEEALQRLRCRVESTTTQLTGMPGGGNIDDKLAIYVQKVDDIEREILRLDTELMKARIDTEQWLLKLPEQQCRVMWEYYIEGAQTWLMVAERLPYSYKHTLRIRDAAMRRL